ncbi:MAG: energy transducer TonB [Gammaproteobacteria bacterium]
MATTTTPTPEPIPPTTPTTPATHSYSDPAGEKKAGWGIFKRGPVGIIVIAAHILVIYVVAASMGIVSVPTLIKPLEAVIIESPQEKTEPVKVIKPDLEQPQIETPPLEDTIPEIEVPTDEPAPAAITAQTSPTPPATETANMTVSKRVDPIYPPQSRRNGEEGSGVFRVLVDATGHPADVSVLKSSGFPKLDEAAVSAIRKWMFKAAMQDGQAVQSWTRVQVTFKLDQA